MSSKQHLNGCDYLMLGFDRELRGDGFAGNSCQMVLELPDRVCPAALQSRLEKLEAHYPVINARPGGLVLPRWKLPRGKAERPPVVRVHLFAQGDQMARRAASALALSHRVFNEPLAIRRGELIRFDLMEREGGRMTLFFTWAHALMDAPGAELFLTLAAREDLRLPAPPSPPPRTTLGLRERCKLGWRNLNQINRFGRTAPHCLGSRHPEAGPMLHYRVERFSPGETEIIRANAVRHCGLLGDGQYHAAVAMLELHHLHQHLGCPSPSYVLPVPVGLRPKGSSEPLFGNQVAMLMFQFLPEQLGSIDDVAAACKTQAQEAMRAGLLDSSRILGDLFRFLPLPVYMAILRRGLRGEICSLFLGDTAAVNPQLTSFLGVPIEDFAHVAPVTPRPGIGIIFCYFRGALRATIVHSLRVLNEAEAAQFATSLRARLLNP